MRGRTSQITDLQDPVLKQIAMVAGREHEDIAQLVVGAAQLIGMIKLHEANFKLLDTIIAEEGADNEVFMGVIINKERMNKEMPREITDVKLLIVDDALEPEEVGDEALGTETGFARYLQLQEEFKRNEKNHRNGRKCSTYRLKRRGRGNINRRGCVMVLQYGLPPGSCAGLQNTPAPGLNVQA